MGGTTVLLSDHALENIKFLKQQGVDLTISKPKGPYDSLLGLGFDQTILDWAMIQSIEPPKKTVEPNVRQSLFESGVHFHAYEVCQYFLREHKKCNIRQNKLKNLLSESLAFFDVEAFYEKEPNDQFIFLRDVFLLGKGLQDLKCLSQKGLDFSKIAYDGSIKELPFTTPYNLEYLGKDNIKIGFLDSLMMDHRISLDDKLDLFGCVLGKEKEGAPNFSTEERKFLLRQGDRLVSQVPDRGAVEKITIDGAKKLLKLYVELSKDLLEIKHAMPSQASPRVSQPYRKALSLTLWLKAYLEKHGESKDIADILGDQASFLDLAHSKFTGHQFIGSTKNEKRIQPFALPDSVVEGDQYSIHQLALDDGDHGQCAAASMVMAGLLSKMGDDKKTGILYEKQSIADLERKFRKKFNKMKAGGGILLRLSRLQEAFAPDRGTPLKKPITDGDIYEVRTDTKDVSVRHAMLAGKRDDHYFFWDVNLSGSRNAQFSKFASLENMIKVLNLYSEFIYGHSPDSFTLIDEAMLERITELKHDKRLRSAGTKGGPPAAGSSVAGSGGGGPSSPALGSGGGGA